MHNACPHMHPIFAYRYLRLHEGENIWTYFASSLSISLKYTEYLCVTLSKHLHFTVFTAV